jgi:RHH-type transcriptional regulator, proline utilization regulon repressor / proline dehydrogenase / delta 1-pyrroline-5-carboxylate dehydrogenase
VQPFGGRGLSGTGPKAGGPLYLGRLVRTKPQTTLTGAKATDSACEALINWLDTNGFAQSARDLRRASAQQLNGHTADLPGPVGESNLYALHPRGEVLLVPATQAGLTLQLGTALSAGNRATIIWPGQGATGFNSLPQQVLERIDWLQEIPAKSKFGAILVEPRAHGMRELIASLANMAGAIPITQVADGDGHYRPEWLVEEVSTSINTTAAGGNASLMAIV